MSASAAESNGGSHDTEALYREHRAAVAALCRSLLRDRGEAEDATQQVFLSAHRALLNGAAPREPLAWLLVVARHECYARFRQRTAHPVPSDDLSDGAAPDASLHVLRAGELETVWDEVRRMPTTQREAFLLREIRGLSYGQLADELSLSAPSVRSLLTRARARLRHRLRDATASLGAAPWVQPLTRLVAGGDGTSPLPAATKAAAIGVGTLALVGGGNLSPGAHRPPRTPGRTVAHQARAVVPHPAKPVGLAVAATGAHHTPAAGRPEPEQSRRSDGTSGSHEGSTDLTGSSDGGSTGSGHNGSDKTTVVMQPTTDGSGSGSGTSSTSGRDGSHDGSSGGSSGPGRGSDGGSTTTTTTSSSDGSGSSGGDSGPDGG